jgi:hypothetical protein
VNIYRLTLAGLVGFCLWIGWGALSRQYQPHCAAPQFYAYGPSGNFLGATTSPHQWPVLGAARYQPMGVAERTSIEQVGDLLFCRARA